MRDPLAPKENMRADMDQQLWPVIIGGVVAALGVIVGWFQSHKKAEIDESTLVLGKWKELVEQHQNDIRALKEEFLAYKKSAEEELEAVRHRLRDVEREFADYRRSSETRMREMEAENVGLRRAIGQTSRSTAVLLGTKKGIDPEDADFVDRIDRAGDNSIRKGKGKDVKGT